MTGGEWMRAEIAEQPQRWRDLLARTEEIADAAGLIRRVDPELLLFVARGSSDHAALYAQYLAHTLLGVPAALATPASVTAHGARLRYPRSVALAISQSGRSPDLLATARAISDAGVPVVSYTNDRTSDLAALGTPAVDLAAGPELAVAATKTYTAELLALALTLLLAAGREQTEIDAQVTHLADAVERDLHDTEVAAATSAATAALAGHDRVLVVGRGYSMSSAKEGALKLMETNAIAASGWSAADAIHGPLGQVVPRTPIVLLTSGPGGRESVEEFAAKAAALDATLIEVGPGVLPEATLRIPVPTVADILIPLAEIVPLQRIAHALAVATGRDPDAPAGLRKVTLTT